MLMMNLMSVPEAAGVLGISPARVRALITAGRFPASKVSNRWLLDPAVVEKRRAQRHPPGRPFSPSNAWALVLLASGEAPRKIDPSVRSRLKRALKQEGLERLRPRLAGRAEPLLYRAHPGEIAYVLGDSSLVPSGISAAAASDIGLVSGREADGYIRSQELDAFVARHVLEPAGQSANVRLRVVPDEAWRFLVERDFAPRAAVGLDLMEDTDARSVQEGRNLLRELEGAYGGAGGVGA